MFAKFINVRFKDNFSYFVVKLKTVGSMEHVENSEKALSYVGIWEKNLLVAEGQSLIDERREGGTRNGCKWDLETLWMERSTKERNMWDNMRSCLRRRLHKAVHSNNVCQCWWRDR